MLLDLLTPVAKSWPSQWCLEANSLAIQVHGGYGYTRDYNVEQFYRDNRLNPIHEGTHGIQAQDLLGRKVMIKQGAALRLFSSEVELTCRNASDYPELRQYTHELRNAMERIAGVTTTLWIDRNPQKALTNATYYLEAFGHVVVAWIWLQQACIAIDKKDEFYLGKLTACRYFFEAELPKIGPQLDFLQSRNELFLTMQDAWF
jgi:hypothetical protein